ncbi:MAG: hypothetical protein ACRDF1_13265 [bacterium]
MNQNAKSPKLGGEAARGLMIRYWLRWLAVLPGAILAGILVLFPLHWALYLTLIIFVRPYPDRPERVLTPLVIGPVFIWAGSRIAPQYRVETAVGLFGLCMALLVDVVYLTLSDGTFMGRRLYSRAIGSFRWRPLLGGSWVST